MKKVFQISLLLTFMLAIVGCEKEDFLPVNRNGNDVGETITDIDAVTDPDEDEDFEDNIDTVTDPDEDEDFDDSLEDVENQ